MLSTALCKPVPGAAVRVPARRSRGCHAFAGRSRVAVQAAMQRDEAAVRLNRRDAILGGIVAVSLSLAFPAASKANTLPDISSASASNESNSQIAFPLLASPVLDAVLAVPNDTVKIAGATVALAAGTALIISTSGLSMEPQAAGPVSLVADFEEEFRGLWAAAEQDAAERAARAARIAALEAELRPVWAAAEAVVAEKVLREIRQERIREMEGAFSAQWAAAAQEAQRLILQKAQADAQRAAALSAAPEEQQQQQGAARVGIAAAALVLLAAAFIAVYNHL